MYKCSQSIGHDIVEVIEGGAIYSASLKRKAMANVVVTLVYRLLLATGPLGPILHTRTVKSRTKPPRRIPTNEQPPDPTAPYVWKTNNTADIRYPDTNFDYYASP